MKKEIIKEIKKLDKMMEELNKAYFDNSLPLDEIDRIENLYNRILTKKILLTLKIS